MKKLLFAAFDMNVGGIETALLTLLNYLVDDGYDITLVLERKQGAFLQDLNKKIKIIEYKPSDYKNIFLRKIINAIKRINFILKYKNKFDFSASFATYSEMASFVARTASKNNALWGHADYLELFKQDPNKVRAFFDNLHCLEFRNIIFVSKKASQTFLIIYPDMKEKVTYCNNLIDYKKIQLLAEEKIDEKKEVYTFINVGRHDELQKKLTRIIEAAKMLKKDKVNFKILFIGDGKDTASYKKMVKEYELQEQIEFLGAKKNPYPYMKMADAVLLSSDYEGYPVVFLEAITLNKPIITTNISDAMDDIQNRYGQVVEKNANDLYRAMKNFVQYGYEIKEKFEPEEYNQEIIKTLEKIFNQ